MRTLSDFSTEDLQKELERRERLSKIPQRMTHIALKELIDYIESGLIGLSEQKRVNSFEQHVFELTLETMIEFRLADTAEICLMRVSQILCLFPERFQLRTVEHAWTLQVMEEDWERVESAFRSAYLGNKVRTK